MEVILHHATDIDNECSLTKATQALNKCSKYLNPKRIHNIGQDC